MQQDGPFDSRTLKPTCVVAIGGNALIKAGQRGTIEEKEANAREACGYVLTILERDFNLVITHGNGPQVGILLTKNEMAKDVVPIQPLDLLVAQTEGSMGYLLQQEILNNLRRRKIHSYVVTMITQVMVDPHDPAFDNPSKPIGLFYTQDEAADFGKTRKWRMVEDAQRGYRRLVPSPEPLKIVQRHMINDLARAGNVVICLGGGGIPITQAPNGDYVGVEAVVDKDKGSALLAKNIDADCFILLTGEDRVWLDYGTDKAAPLDLITVAQAQQHLEQGQFPAGSMGPKIESALRFMRAGGREVIITDPTHLEDALQGKAGTRIVH